MDPDRVHHGPVRRRVGGQALESGPILPTIDPAVDLHAPGSDPAHLQSRRSEHGVRTEDVADRLNRVGGGHPPGPSGSRQATHALSGDLAQELAQEKSPEETESQAEGGREEEVVAGAWWAAFVADRAHPVKLIPQHGAPHAHRLPAFSGMDMTTPQESPTSFPIWRWMLFAVLVLTGLGLYFAHVSRAEPVVAIAPGGGSE